MDSVEVDREDSMQMLVCLPNHIIIYEILTRITAKILLRFKSVSKLWYKSMSDRYFIKLHLNQCRLLSSGQSNYCFNDVYYAVRDLDNVYDTFSSCVIPVASCDGLLVVRVSHLNPHFYELLYVGNFVTRKFARLPILWTKMDSCRLVYDNANDQYKLFVWPRACHESSKWKVFKFVLGGCNTNIGAWKMISRPKDALKYEKHAPVVFNGIAYWVSCHVEKNVVLTMDLETEEIRESHLPICGDCGDTHKLMNDGYHVMNHKPVDGYLVLKMKGSLYLAYLPKYNHCSVIWILEGKWTQIHYKISHLATHKHHNMLWAEEMSDFDEIKNKALYLYRWHMPCEYDVSGHFDSLLHLEILQSPPCHNYSKKSTENMSKENDSETRE